jgi:short-subunit dehydrogenase
MTKHAVVALSESLHHELAIIGSKIKVSVVSPAFIKKNQHNGSGEDPPIPAAEHCQTSG